MQPYTQPAARAIARLGACTCATLFYLATAAAADASVGARFVLEGAHVAPPAQHTDDGFFVAAHTSTLRTALIDADLHEQLGPVAPRTLEARASSSASRAERGDAAAPLPDAAPASMRVVGAARSWRALDVVPLSARLGDLPLWWVQPVDGVAQAVCTTALEEPWTLFLRGLAHASWAPRLHAAGAAARLITLRHAASELEAGLPSEPAERRAQGPAQKAAAAAPEALVCLDRPPEPAHLAAPDAAERARRVADSVLWHSAAHGRRIALTFDACSTYTYGPFNPEVIATLRALDVPATLFIGGHWAEMHPDELQRLARDERFELGNHTYSHPHLRDLPPDAQRQELLWTQQIIHAQTGVLPRVFRPPYGELDDAMLQQVAAAGLITVQYDLPAGDADVHVSPARLTQWVVGQATPGSIVIMHMNRPHNHTAEALPRIVAQLRAQGFVFCRMRDLLADGGSDGQAAGCR